MHFLHSNPQWNVGGDRRANTPRMIDSKHKLHKSAIARLLSHGWYGRNWATPSTRPFQTGSHVFDRYFLLRLAWVNAPGPSAWAGFLVRTGAANAHGAE